MKSDREVCIMRKRRILAVTAATLTLGLAGAAIALPQVASGQVRTLATVRQSHPSPALERRGPGDPAGPGCGYTKAVPFDRYKGLPNFTKKKAARRYIAVMHTTQGVIEFRALTAKAPCTTFSFRFLAQRGYFFRTHCHRLTLKGIFVLQCGDPTGTGSGGPGYRFNDENLAGATYPAGTVAMANAGPNTNGSQFFFVWKNTTLAPDYTPFGVVIKGMNVLRKIAAAGDDSQNGPGDGYPHLYVQFGHIKIMFAK
jgi:peptidyl-prolyl cis-trans isomerase B (cyclophilin B)